MVMRQSMLPCRQNSQVPSRPVKMKLNRAVPMAVCVESPARTLRAGISRMPPTPTVPMSPPTRTATRNNRRNIACSMIVMPWNSNSYAMLIIYINLL